MKEAITQTLGKHYSPKIIKFLNEKGIVNKKGEPYKQDSIHKIISGEVVNVEVETAIVELISETEKARKRNVSKLKRLTRKPLKNESTSN